MKVVNKELGILVDMSERQARICLKRNPRKYTLPESVEEIELEEEEDGEEPANVETQTPKPKDPIQPVRDPVQDVSGGVIEAKTKDVGDRAIGTIEDVNASVDATKGAKDMANKNDINLNDLGIAGRIVKTDVENYLSTK